MSSGPVAFTPSDIAVGARVPKTHPVHAPQVAHDLLSSIPMRLRWILGALPCLFLAACGGGADLSCSFDREGVKKCLDYEGMTNEQGQLDRLRESCSEPGWSLAEGRLCDRKSAQSGCLQPMLSSVRVTTWWSSTPQPCLGTVVAP